MFLQNSEMEQDFLFFLIGLLFFLLILYLIFMCGYGIMVLVIGRDKLLDKSEFIKENIDETIFMFALFKCRKSDKGRN